MMSLNRQLFEIEMPEGVNIETVKDLIEILKSPVFIGIEGETKRLL